MALLLLNREAKNILLGALPNVCNDNAATKKVFDK